MPEQADNDIIMAAARLRGLQANPAVLPPPQQTLTQAQKLAALLKTQGR